MFTCLLHLLRPLPPLLEMLQRRSRTRTASIQHLLKWKRQQHLKKRNPHQHLPKWNPHRHLLKWNRHQYLLKWNRQ